MPRRPSGWCCRRRFHPSIDIKRPTSFSFVIYIITALLVFCFAGVKAVKSTLLHQPATARAATSSFLQLRKQTPSLVGVPRRLRPSITLKMSASEVSGGTTAATEPVTTTSPTSSDVVNLLELASAAIACTVTASRKITALSSLYKDQKNARLKGDGSFVTDADYLAQGAIVDAILRVSTRVRVVGEESAEEMAVHVHKFDDISAEAHGDNDEGEEDEAANNNGSDGAEKKIVADNGDTTDAAAPVSRRGRKRRISDTQQQQQQAMADQDILERTRAEVRYRLLRQSKTTSSGSESAQPTLDVLPLSPSSTSSSAPSADSLSSTALPFPATDVKKDPDDCFVEARRVSVIVDPLDGTKSYAHGDYDAVSILVGIVVDNTPVFGVIGKPFGYTGLPPIMDTGCVTIYGGPLLHGVYVAGRHEPVIPVPLTAAVDSTADDSGVAAATSTETLKDLPKAVISSSRSQGVVQDFCVHLGTKGLIDPTPLHISGAGEKSLRLILQRNNEALWFFPKGGTSRWDVAAPDALLRSLGGRLSDKYGKDLDYGVSREGAENVDGIVACIDEKLHAECIRLFQEGDWGERN